MLTQQEKKRNFDRMLKKHMTSITSHAIKLTNLKNRQYYDYSAAEVKEALSKIRKTIDQVEFMMEH